MPADELLKALKKGLTDEHHVKPRKGNNKTTEEFILNQSSNYIEYQLMPGETTPVSIGISAIIKTDNKIHRTRGYPAFLEEPPLNNNEAYYILTYSQLLHELSDEEKDIAEYKISLHRFLFHTLKNEIDFITSCEKISKSHFNRRIVYKLIKINDVATQDDIKQAIENCIQIIDEMFKTMSDAIDRYKNIRTNKEDSDEGIVDSLQKSLSELNDNKELINSTAQETFVQFSNDGDLDHDSDFEKLFLRLPPALREQYYEQVWRTIAAHNTPTTRKKETSAQTDMNDSRNRIIFGAPGTGKSHLLKNESKRFKQIERVTFHPEYSYFDFVGSYKPVMEKVKDNEGNETGDERIKYRFVPGPFARVLANAMANPNEDNLLIIEEINRARVAAVFGDIFQLLDRDSEGKSEYDITPSEELKAYLQITVANIRAALKTSGEYSVETQSNTFERIAIPENMYIWATMNSADQGVYPMDTAFKRRWSFEYIGINKGTPEGAFAQDWMLLRNRLNTLLQQEGINEDKQMGPFFLKGSELGNKIDFLSAVKNKVLMYIFEDAAKHKRKSIFNLDNKDMRYSKICDVFDETYNATSSISDVIDKLFHSIKQ